MLHFFSSCTFFREIQKTVSSFVDDHVHCFSVGRSVGLC